MRDMHVTYVGTASGPAEGSLLDDDRPDGAACPYPGLSSFGADEAGWFFGRESYLAELAELLADPTTRGPVVLVASSGAGKSSLLRAGLIPKIEHGVLPDPESRSWLRLIMTPTGNPLTALAEELATATGLPAADLAAKIRERPADAGRVVAESLTWQRLASRIVLVIDQFEEVFTLCEDEAGRAAFVTAVNALAEPPSWSAESAALVVLGLRADFYAQATGYPELRAALKANQLLLGPMKREELDEAIARPAYSVGLGLEPGLAKVLIRDLGVTEPDDGPGHADYEAGRLPLLAHALRATWQQRSGRTLTIAGYEKTGGISGAIARTAERIYTQLDEADQERSRFLFLRLIVIGDSSDDTRRRLTALELAAPGDDQDRLARLIELYTAARLLSRDRDQMEIAHEVLLRAWPRLRGWIDADRDGLRAAQQAEDAAQAWERAGHDQSLLYRRLMLDSTAEKLGLSARPSSVSRLLPQLRDRARPAPGQGAATATLSPRAARFLDASARLHRRESRLKRAAVATLAALTLAAGSLAGYATLQRDQARSAQAEAEFQQVTAEAGKLASTDTSLAAVLEAAAYRMHPTPGGYTTLLETEQNSLATRLDTGSRALSSDVSANGDLLAVQTDRGVQLWSIARSGAPAQVNVPPSVFGVQAADIADISFSGTGQTLAIARTTGGTTLWNLADPAHPAAEETVPTPPQGQGGAPNGSGFLGSDRFVAYDASVFRVWTIGPGRESGLEATLKPCGNAAIGTATENGDNSVVAVGCRDGSAAVMTGMSSPHPAVASRFKVAGSPVTTVTLNASGDLLAATAPADSNFQIWNTQNASKPVELGFGDSDSPVDDMAFVPGAPLLAVGTAEGVISWWVVGDSIYPPAPSISFIKLKQSMYSALGTIDQFELTPDGKNLIAIYGDGGILIWHIPQSVSLNTGPVQGTVGMSFAGDGTVLAELSYTLSGERLQVNPVLSPEDLGPPVYLPQVCGGRLFSFSLGRRDGRNLLAAECIDESVELWDITDLRAPHRMRESLPNEPAGDSVESVAFSPSGNMMAVAAVPSSDDYAIIQLWSLAASGVPKLFWSTVIHNSDLPAVTFSDQGETLAASDDGTGAVDVWDIAGNSVAAGRSFLSPSDSFEDNPSPVTFVPGSPLLVNANAANGMDVWNTAGSSTQRPTEELSGGTGIVTDLSTSPDGHWLVSADQDGTIRLWDQVQPDKFALYGNPLNPDSAWELDTAFSPVSDGTFATLDNTGAVYLWDLDPGSAINRICADTANILTPSVWSQTLPGVPYQPPCG